MASVTSSRGASSSTNRSPSSLTSSAPSPRTASVTRKPSRSPGTATAVGWNCMNSRSASAAPASWASVRPEPIAPRGFVVRCHSAAAPPVASTVAAAGIAADSVTTPAQRPSSTHSARADVRSCTSMRVLGGHQLGQARRHVPAGRAAAGVGDAAARVTALQGQQQLPVRPSGRTRSRAAPARARAPAPRRRGSRPCAGRWRRAPRRRVSARCRSTLVVGVERRREPALGPVARRLRQRRARHEHHARAAARPRPGRCRGRPRRRPPRRRRRAR